MRNSRNPPSRQLTAGQPRTKVWHPRPPTQFRQRRERKERFVRILRVLTGECFSHAHIRSMDGSVQKLVFVQPLVALLWVNTSDTVQTNEANDVTVQDALATAFLLNGLSHE